MKNQLKLWSAIAGAVACSLTSFGEASSPPVVSNVTMEQDNNRLVTITYEIADAPGIVTLDILTNGVSIGAGNIQYLLGDVNRKVEAGPHTITWRPDKSWPGHKVDQATAKVCVWDTSAPPDYMAVNLVTGERNWYTCTNALPGGIGGDRYRENILLMRRICQPNGGKWVMGSPASCAGEGWRQDCEAFHEVALTNDFWIGVFEVTQKQWDMVKGERPSAFQGDAWAGRPVERVSYNMIRGENADYYYPNAPEPGSFLGKLRDLTGLPFDLPSEMQWEYACRAGTGSALNSGRSVTEPRGQDPAMDQVGRYSRNGGQRSVTNANNEVSWVTGEATARVGSYLPNAWGLYDMHGNVWEWCLDWLKDDITDLDGQVNTASGAVRVSRGGSWYHVPAFCRSAIRNGNAPSLAGNDYGFRLVCSAGL